MIQIPKGIKFEVKELKKCQFPNCNEYYFGTGFSKYCHEHRKRKYRKILDAISKKNKKPSENPNKYYKHDNKIHTVENFVCPLCGKVYEVMVYPNIYVYPNYCPEHMNEYKRKLYKSKHNIKQNKTDCVVIDDGQVKIVREIE